MTAALGTWRNPPLAYVVAELVISPYYSMAATVPGLQDSLRAGYPRTLEAQELVLDSNAPPGAPQQVWQLLSADQHRGVQIGQRAISLHATSYVNSHDFLGQWSEVLQAIANADLGAYVERVGLRYVDLIVPDTGNRPNDYLAAGLRGVPIPQGGVLKSGMWVISFEVDDRTINVRTAAPSPEGILLPPNLHALPLRKPAIMSAAEQRMKAFESIGLVDIDCLSEVQEVFEPLKIAERFASMHELTSTTFQSMLSETALEQWQ